MIQIIIPTIPNTNPALPVEESGSLDRAIAPKMIAMMFPMIGIIKNPKIPKIKATVPLVFEGG